MVIGSGSQKVTQSDSHISLRNYGRSPGRPRQPISVQSTSGWTTSSSTSGPTQRPCCSVRARAATWQAGPCIRSTTRRARRRVGPICGSTISGVPGARLFAGTGATLADLMGRLGHTAPAAMIYQHAAEERGKMLSAGLSDLVRPSAT